MYPKVCLTLNNCVCYSNAGRCNTECHIVWASHPSPRLCWCGHWRWRGQTHCPGQLVNDGVWFQNCLCLTLKPVPWTPADKIFPGKSPARSWSSGWVCGQSRVKKTEWRPQEKGKCKPHTPVSALSILHELTHLIFMTPIETATTMKHRGCLRGSVG